MKKLITSFFMVFAALLAISCSKPNKAAEQGQLFTAKLEPDSATLYFNGTIEPIKSYIVVSPVTGYIKRKYFALGTAVAKDQLLYTISSPQAEKEYNDAFGEYIKAKRELTNSQSQLSGTQELHKLGIVSQAELTGDQTREQNSRISYQQAEKKLETVAAQVGISIPFLDKSKPNINTVQDTSFQRISTVKVFSPATGIAIAPSGGSSAEIENKMVNLNEPLLSIGNMSSLHIPIKVNETQIQLIKTEQKVTVTGNGFPDMKLNGIVAIKERQPISSGFDSGGSANYLVHIIINKLSDQEKDIIRAGMTAQIEVHMDRPPNIKIPVAAVHQINGKDFVTKINAQGRKEEVQVEVGETTPDSIVIRSGLNSGDQIYVPSSGEGNSDGNTN